MGGPYYEPRLVLFENEYRVSNVLVSTYISLYIYIILSIVGHESSVAFSATLATGAVTYSRGDRIPFPTVIANAGGGWQISANEFICSQTGVYMFSLTTVSDNNSNSGVVNIIMDGVIKATAFAGSSQKDSTGVVVFVQCSEASKVYCECGDENCRLLFLWQVSRRMPQNSHALQYT